MHKWDSGQYPQKMSHLSHLQKPTPDPHTSNPSLFRRPRKRYNTLIMSIFGALNPNVPPSFTFSENIKKMRAKLGLTQDDLAKKADVKYTTLIKVESGTFNKPSVQTMAKIAKALGVSIENLIK